MRFFPSMGLKSRFKFPSVERLYCITLKLKYITQIMNRAVTIIERLLYRAFLIQSGLSTERFINRAFLLWSVLTARPLAGPQL